MIETTEMIKAIANDSKVRIDRIVENYKQLEKENAELKKLKQECETSLCRAEYQYNYEQLTKAKEIIQHFVNECKMCIAYPEAYKTWYQEIAEAEQFLSEGDK